MEYNLDKKSHKQIGNKTFYKFIIAKDVYIPEMLSEENVELNDILNRKMKRAP